MKISFLLIISFCFLKKFIHNRLIKKEDYDLSNIFPKFIKVETLPSPTETFLKFQVLENYPFEYKYRLFVSELDKDKYQSNLKFFKNWLYEDEDYDSFIENDNTLWKNWRIILETNERIIKITNILPNTYYRFKFIIFNKYSSSKESEINYLKTPRTKIHDNYVNLYLKGTGRNNHANSIIKVNDIEIINNGLFQGLALVVFDRSDMSVIDISYYDTLNPPAQNKFKSITYTDYSYDVVTNDLASEVKQKEILDKSDYPSNLLNEKLKKLTEKHMIAIVSCYGWEKFITNDLIDTLLKFGALNLLEYKTFLNIETSRTNTTFDYDIVNKTYLFHPFAFVGIPNIGATNGFESLRTNKGHFLTVTNLPFAELLVKIKFDEKALNFYFDKQQYDDKSYYSDDYDYLFNSIDYSLKNLIDLIIYSNTPNDSNYLFSIYDSNKFVQKYLPKSATVNKDIYETTFDVITIGKNKGSQKKNSDGFIFQDGVIFENLDYYNYYYQVAVNKTDCPLPYTADIPQCPKIKLSNRDIPILKCRIGLTPQVCEDNVRKEFMFKGFFD